MQEIKNYILKNLKSLIFVIIIVLLMLLNIKQYKKSVDVYQENTKINSEYAALKEKTSIYEKQIYVYENTIKSKNIEIDSSKRVISKTESELQVSQTSVKKLSKRISSQNKVVDSGNIKDYVNDCDSLAIVAPILSDQVDSLKSQNKVLVNTVIEKSELQDSIIKVKNIQIGERNILLDKTVKSYNTTVAKLSKTEDKLSKETKRKGTWKKIAIGLGTVIGGIFILK